MKVVEVHQEGAQEEIQVEAQEAILEGVQAPQSITHSTATGIAAMEKE